MKKVFRNKKAWAGAGIAAGVVLVGAAIWFSYNQGLLWNKKKAPETQSSSNQTQEQIQNVENKANSQSNSNTTTTAPKPAETPSTAKLTDVSLTATQNIDTPNSADVYLYGPAGMYRVERIVNGSWTTTVSSLSYSGSGGYNIGTMNYSDGDAHFRISKISNGSVSATSGDTVIAVASVKNNGTVSVPVAG